MNTLLDSFAHLGTERIGMRSSAPGLSVLVAGTFRSAKAALPLWFCGRRSVDTAHRLTTMSRSLKEAAALRDIIMLSASPQCRRDLRLS
jgi:hypothetical protein